VNQLKYIFKMAWLYAILIATDLYDYLLTIIRIGWRIIWALSQPLRRVAMGLWKWTWFQKICVLLAGLSFWWLSRARLDRLVIKWPSIHAHQVPLPWIIGLSFGALVAAVYIIGWLIRRGRKPAEASSTEAEPAKEKKVVKPTDPRSGRTLDTISGLATLIFGLALLVWSGSVFVWQGPTSPWQFGSFWTVVASFISIVLVSITKNQKGLDKAEPGYHPIKSLLSMALWAAVFFFIGRLYMAYVSQVWPW
jgi:hypothetical protein